MKISKDLLLITMLALALVSSVISCKDDDNEDLIGNWIELADFGGDSRSEAVAFAIGEMGYIGTGYNGDDRLKDFYAYDANTNNWQMIAAPPDTFAPRTGAVAFAAAGKGYVGTGRSDERELSDFWSYDPNLNTWDTVASFPSARYGSVAFSINDIGYVGTGYDGNALLDFWSYNPGTDTWSQIANYPSKVREAVAFVIDGMGYVCTGEKNSTAINDFYMYDPGTGIWNMKRKIANISDESYDDEYTIERSKAVAFTIAGKGYITTGELSGYKNDVWEYDPLLDEWTERTSFEGNPRSNAVAFTTASGRSFVAAGINGSSTYYDDLFEFKPGDEYNEDD